MPTDSDFDAALNLARQLASEPKWAEYVAYLEARGKALRQPALARARSFAGEAANWSFEERWNFTQAVLNRLRAFCTRDIPLPHPIVAQLLRPTLSEAAERFPNDPWPVYWLGQEGIFDWQMIAPDADRDRFSREALRRNPTFQPALKDLVSLLLRNIDFEQHELPHGYLGDPTRTLRVLAEVHDFVVRLEDEQERRLLTERLEDNEGVAQQYLAFQEVTEGTYQQWCDERGLPYR